ncbi:MAG: hypothetical protein JWR80_7617 [Bradyrhizobium sp.]|nr:hypothetical protein [Bradyrhizobium sp.]
MAAFLLYLCKDVTDRRELDTYWAEIGPTLKDSGAENLAAYTQFEVLEGEQKVEGVVLTQFPSKEAVKAWYDSPEYTEVRKHRMKGARYLGLVIEGGWLPPEQRMPHTKGNG